MRYSRSRRQSIDLIRQLALAEKPDLFITDFEPLTAIVAASLRAECVSVDNQHRFCEPLAPTLPLLLRAYGRLAGIFVESWIRHPVQCIVAVFHRCPESKKFRGVDALMRNRFSQLSPTDGEHILLYAKGVIGKRIARITSTVPAKFIAYGCPEVPASNIECKDVNSDDFITDLASCRGVLCTAGQQLIGEAKYFGKPVLVVPIPGQHEQEINARYARIEGIGDYCPIDHLTSALITSAFYKPKHSAKPGNGVEQVIDLLGINNG
jgi:uncharacterized protein (TIGR00661 family)